ncbi:TetR/AcrR family transcriptional regulator [Granulicella arctica]|uniref:TetR/AcrR family transcriptional regulator n=1 Tax=Granulicella arctica TaxID=940613 RepID=UPI0021E09A14|nr:TetR/AcrR family transcriptional regulator [Granulicella arctica]
MAKEIISSKRSRTPAALGMENRATILDAATQVFLAKRYSGTSMELIAEAAGVARRTLYNQFPDGKEAIFRAVVEHFWSKFPVMALATDEIALRDPRFGLTKTGNAIADFWKTKAVIAFLRLAISEIPQFPDLAETFFEAGKLPLMEEFVSYLQALSGHGCLAISDVELAMRQFFGLVNEPLLWVKVLGIETSTTPRSRRKVVDSAVEMFLKTYGTAKCQM